MASRRILAPSSPMNTGTPCATWSSSPQWSWWGWEISTPSKLGSPPELSPGTAGSVAPASPTDSGRPTSRTIRSPQVAATSTQVPPIWLAPRWIRTRTAHRPRVSVAMNEAAFSEPGATPSKLVEQDRGRLLRGGVATTPTLYRPLRAQIRPHWAILATGCQQDAGQQQVAMDSAGRCRPARLVRSGGSARATGPPPPRGCGASPP